MASGKGLIFINLQTPGFAAIERLCQMFAQLVVRYLLLGILNLFSGCFYTVLFSSNILPPFLICTFLDIFQVCVLSWHSPPVFLFTNEAKVIMVSLDDDDIISFSSLLFFFFLYCQLEIAQTPEEQCIFAILLHWHSFYFSPMRYKSWEELSVWIISLAYSYIWLNELFP